MNSLSKKSRKLVEQLIEQPDIEHWQPSENGEEIILRLKKQ